MNVPQRKTDETWMAITVAWVVARAAAFAAAFAAAAKKIWSKFVEVAPKLGPVLELAQKWMAVALAGSAYATTSSAVAANSPAPIVFVCIGIFAVVIGTCTVDLLPEISSFCGLVALDSVLFVFFRIVSTIFPVIWFPWACFWACNIIPVTCFCCYALRDDQEAGPEDAIEKASAERSKV